MDMAHAAERSSCCSPPLQLPARLGRRRRALRCAAEGGPWRYDDLSAAGPSGLASFDDLLSQQLRSMERAQGELLEMQRQMDARFAAAQREAQRAEEAASGSGRQAEQQQGGSGPCGYRWQRQMERSGSGGMYREWRSESFTVIGVNPPCGMQAMPPHAATHLGPLTSLGLLLAAALAGEGHDWLGAAFCVCPGCASRELSALPRSSRCRSCCRLLGRGHCGFQLAFRPHDIQRGLPLAPAPAVALPPVHQRRVSGAILGGGAGALCAGCGGERRRHRGVCGGEAGVSFCAPFTMSVTPLFMHFEFHCTHRMANQWHHVIAQSMRRRLAGQPRLHACSFRGRLLLMG